MVLFVFLTCQLYQTVKSLQIDLLELPGSGITNYSKLLQNFVPYLASMRKQKGKKKELAQYLKKDLGKVSPKLQS